MLGISEGNAYGYSVISSFRPWMENYLPLLCGEICDPCYENISRHFFKRTVARHPTMRSFALQEAHRVPVRPAGEAWYPVRRMTVAPHFGQIVSSLPGSW